MTENVASVIISGFTMITSITCTVIVHYTNRRTKRIEKTQKESQLHLALALTRFAPDDKNPNLPQTRTRTSRPAEDMG